MVMPGLVPSILLRRAQCLSKRDDRDKLGHASGVKGASKGRNPMKLKLHHVNFATTDVAGMDKFYRDVLDMQTIPGRGRNRKKDEGYPGDVAFVTDGALQMHIAEKDMQIGFRTGKVVNPVERGHIAFRTDDLDAFRKRLDAMGIQYSDFGDWAMAGWKQIFFYDPDGNVVEVHQAPKDAP
jgi:glyoxylase I family protein